MNLYDILGYFSGLYFINPQMEPSALVRTVALVHFLDAILCRVIAAHGGRRKNAWTVAGLVLGVWAMATLCLLPAKAPDKSSRS